MCLRELLAFTNKLLWWNLCRVAIQDIFPFSVIGGGDPVLSDFGQNLPICNEQRQRVSAICYNAIPAHRMSGFEAPLRIQILGECGQKLEIAIYSKVQSFDHPSMDHLTCGYKKPALGAYEIPLVDVFLHHMSLCGESHMLFWLQITWTRQLEPDEARVGQTGEGASGFSAAVVHTQGSSESSSAAAGASPALAIESAAGKYEILTIAEMTHISDDRFIIASAAVNNVSAEWVSKSY